MSRNDSRPQSSAHSRGPITLHEADNQLNQFGKLNRFGGAGRAAVEIISGLRPQSFAALSGVNDMRVIFLFALGLLSSLTAAHAGTVTVFSDRAAFESGFNSVTTEDFGPYYGSGLTITSGVLNASTYATNGTFTVNPGDIVAGVTFSTAPGALYSFNLDLNYFFSGALLSSLRSTGTRDLTVSFDFAAGRLRLRHEFSDAELRCHDQLRVGAEPDIQLCLPAARCPRGILPDLLRLGEFGGGHNLGGHRIEPHRHERPELRARQFRFFCRRHDACSCGPPALRHRPRWIWLARTP